MKRKRSTVEDIPGNFGSETISTCGETKCSTFFKLMLSPSSQSLKLRIPQKFATIHRDELSDSATLIVPTGEAWKVALVSEDNELWFREGWKRFVDNYSIQYGYFMLFKYERNMEFMVHIFDTTLCEISYQCNLQKSSPPESGSCHSDIVHEVVHDKELEGSCEEKSVSLESSDFVPRNGNDSGLDLVHDKEFEGSCEEKSVSLESLGFVPRNGNDFGVEVMQLESEDDVHVSDVEGVPPPEDNKHCAESEFVNEAAPSELPGWLLPQKELLKAVIAAGITLPKNPFFVCLMKPYNLYHTRTLRIPMQFSKAHLYARVKSKIIKLEAQDGRQCEVRCIISRDSCFLSQGWTVYAQLVGLEVGDVCVFELSPTIHNLLKVHVTKNSQIKDSLQLS